MLKQHVENFTYVEHCNACWEPCQNYNMCMKTMLKRGMLKISHVLNTVTDPDSHVKTSRHVENVYVRHVEHHSENHV